MTSSNINALKSPFRDILDSDYVKEYDAKVVGHLLEHQVSIDDVRKSPTSFRVNFGVPESPPPEIGSTEDIEIPVADGEKIYTRVYRPATTEVTPAHVNFHGGGWTIGGIGADAHWCHTLVLQANATVFDVGYRLAPEHKFPTAIDDSWAVLSYIYENATVLKIDPNRISLGGVSAGAHLAAVITHLAIRNSSIRPIFLALVAPVIDASALDSNFDVAKDCPYDSWRSMHDAPFLSHARMSWFYRHFLPDAPARAFLQQPTLSPIYSVRGAASSAKFEPHLHPPTLVCTAEVDVLCSEGEAYGNALAEKGVVVTMKRFIGVPHNWSRQTRLLKQARDYVHLSVGMIADAMRGAEGRNSDTN